MKCADNTCRLSYEKYGFFTIDLQKLASKIRIF